MKHCDQVVAAGRRALFARTAAVAAGAAVTAVLPAAPVAARQAPTLVTYPVVKLCNLRDLTTNEPRPIRYPDADSPGVLLKLGAPVDDGVGPDGDIVAFSTRCPHMGVLLSYHRTDQTLNCPGHYSRFDCEKGGLQIFGHSTQNLPQFALRVDKDGDLFAEFVDELLYGRLSNVL